MIRFIRFFQQYSLCAFPGFSISSALLFDLSICLHCCLASTRTLTNYTRLNKHLIWISGTKQTCGSASTNQKLTFNKPNQLPKNNHHNGSRTLRHHRRDKAQCAQASEGKAFNACLPAIRRCKLCNYTLCYEPAYLMLVFLRPPKFSRSRH